MLKDSVKNSQLFTYLIDMQIFFFHFVQNSFFKIVCNFFLLKLRKIVKFITWVIDQIFWIHLHRLFYIYLVKSMTIRPSIFLLHFINNIIDFLQFACRNNWFYLTLCSKLKSFCQVKSCSDKWTCNLHYRQKQLLELIKSSQYWEVPQQPFCP